MRNADEKVKTIPKCFVGEDYAQVIFWFEENITLINTDFKDEKMLCHYDFDSDTQNINKYLEDERRKAFAYHNIPMYQDYLGYSVRYYLNQILEFNKHYILVGCHVIQDIYLVKDGGEAKKLSRSITIPSNIEKTLLHKNEIFNKYNEKVVMTIDNRGHHIDFIKDFDILINSGGGFLIIKENSETTIQNKKEPVKFVIVSTSKFMESQKYYLREYIIPLNHYTLEELKFMSSKIEEVEEPKICLRTNPNISKEELRKAKKMAKKLNRSK